MAGQYLFSLAWTLLYMYGVEQYALERYLDNLRATIPQQWQNGLPVIEDLVAQSDYTQHARWMAALRHYEALLAKWRVDHHRRRNLWQALAKMGLT